MQKAYVRGGYPGVFEKPEGYAKINKEQLAEKNLRRNPGGGIRGAYKMRN